MALPRKQLQILTPARWAWRQLRRYWHSSWWSKTVTCGVIAAALCTSGMYGIAVWYQHTQRNKPLALGVTFIPGYATYLGLDAHQTYQAILGDLHVKHLRLVSYWSDVEPAKGQYDFSELDYEMGQAAAHGAKVSLAIGLRQPRWPECHPPSWVDTTKPASNWEPALNAYMTAVIQRYQHNPALESYQLENEYYLNAFGECHNFDRGRLSHELALVHRLDPSRQVIMSRSNNYAGFSLRAPLPDVVGISLYRHVWSTPIHRYLTYPFPSWYYAFLAGAEQLLTGKPSLIHELQTEPWPPDGQGIPTTSLAEQNKTFDAAKLAATVRYGKQTGIRSIDLWGAEYWYYRAQTLHDPSVWHTAEQIFTQANTTNAQ
ncbi:MAG TPA: beta-galactosidase [Candidatus Saccharimonadales bacterium]|nr:beta-galactosidase [Candidatus Saccharimonadales bacterium]